MYVKIVSFTMLSLLTLVVFGCGSGGGAQGGAGAQVRIATTGILPAGSAIGGISARVLATPATGLSLAADEVAVTGSGAGSTMVANVADAAEVTLGLVNASGIRTGEFSTLGYRVAAGATVSNGTFGIAPGAEVVDLAGAAIPGIAVIVQSVTIR